MILFLFIIKLFLFYTLLQCAVDHLIMKTVQCKFFIIIIIIIMLLLLYFVGFWNHIEMLVEFSLGNFVPNVTAELYFVVQILTVCGVSSDSKENEETNSNGTENSELNK